MSNEYPTNVFVAPWPTGQDGTPLAEVFAAADRAADEMTTVTVEPGGGLIIDSLEAAAMLGVTENNFRQIVHKGHLVPVGRQGRRKTFRREDVRALAERRRNK